MLYDVTVPFISSFSGITLGTTTQPHQAHRVLDGVGLWLRGRSASSIVAPSASRNR